MVRHLFPELARRMNDVTDVRDPALTDYDAATLMWAAVLMFVCRLGSRRQINFVLDNPIVVRYLKALSQQKDLETCPHGDTVRDLLKVVPIVEIRDIVTAMIRSLIEHRRLEAFRLLEEYYLIAIDGTGWLVLGNTPTKFTKGCLTTTLSNGETLYYRPVLEAKLVTRTGLALSVETEFTENVFRKKQSEEEYKQDCERKGIKRLAPRLREAFPQLPICLLLDALHANKPVFDLCKELKFRFIITLKEGSLPSVYREFYALADRDKGNRIEVRRSRWVKQVFRWVNEISYEGHKLNGLECVETNLKTGETTRWLWVTDIMITAQNAVKLANAGGRQRWRIENEGNHVQKNSGYEMEHAYAKAPQAAKNFYLLLQLAHLLAQLFECRMGGKLKVKADFGSLMNLAMDLLESFRREPLPEGPELETFLNTPIQVRLDAADVGMEIPRAVPDTS